MAAATAEKTQARPAERRRADVDIYPWQSWHYRGAFRGILDPEKTFKALCSVEDGWQKLKKNLADSKISNGVLAKMRELMTIAKFDPDLPWLEPTQEWVGDQVKMFLSWYIQNFGEPKPEKPEPKS